MHAPSFRRLLSAVLVPLLCLTPQAAFAAPRDRVAAVSAPSPYSQEADPASGYRAAAQRLKALGCDDGQIRTLWARFGPALTGLLDRGSSPARTLKLLLQPNCRTELLDRYLACAQADPELTPDRVVLTVNIGLDRPFYSLTREVEAPGSTTALVNKYHQLPQDYVPELEALGYPYGSGSLTPEAAAAFRRMADDAWKDGVSLRSVSAYRSYSTQDRLYRNYLSQSSQASVDTFSARAGYSEHQTGLALDINVARTSAHFENTAEFAWLQANCTRYGFLLRYPEGKDSVTGYRFEPWHYRYVGTETARACTEQGLTYEEYLASLPVSPAYQVPDLLWQGELLDLGRDAILLDGVSYLSPERLSALLGWSAELRSGRLVLSGEGHRLVLSPGRVCQLDGKARRLSAPALSLEDRLYLPLDDLCSLLSLTLVPGDQGTELVHSL